MDFNWIRNKIVDVTFVELTEDEIDQTAHYIDLYHARGCTEHWQVNNIITRENKWEEFKAIRSLNDYGSKNKVKGITPQFFAIVCKVLRIQGDDGAPLKDYDKY